MSEPITRRINLIMTVLWVTFIKCILDKIILENVGLTQMHPEGKVWPCYVLFGQIAE